MINLAGAAKCRCWASFRRRDAIFQKELAAEEGTGYGDEPMSAMIVSRREGHIPRVRDR